MRVLAGSRDIKHIGSDYDHAELVDGGPVSLIWALSPRSRPAGYWRRAACRSPSRGWARAMPAMALAVTGRIQGEWTTVTRLGGTGRAICLRWGSSERMARLPAGTTAPELNRAIAVPMIVTSAK